MAGGYLIDTHVFIELGDPSRKLGAHAQSALSDPDAAVYLSVVSVAEIAIKSRLGKLNLPGAIEGELARWMREACEEAGFEVLPITLDHATLLGALPLHHRDPFDRMLIAQALHESLVLVSRDSAFADYQGLALLRP